MANNVNQDKFLELREASMQQNESINRYSQEDLDSNIELTYVKAAGDSKVFTCERKDCTASAEVKSLQAKIFDLETRCSNLMFENEQTSIDLEHEKHKVTQLERQLQFVKDNQAIFEKLREAYISMKYNEASGRKLVEIRDKSVQTWEGVLCRACLDTEKLRMELEQAKTLYNDCVMIKRDDMEQINRTVQTLKSHIGNGEMESFQTMVAKNFNIKSLPIKNVVKLQIKKPDTTAEVQRAHKHNPDRSRSQSVDRGCFTKLNFTYNCKHKGKMSRSLTDIGKVNHSVNRLHH